ncbi:hypothetical protein X737_04455 [Mesorhizobium sp. L48C026A00]|nr:hypothetical protein X737_04455 [Mesorhizobium sp. L48C026A00]
MGIESDRFSQVEELDHIQAPSSRLDGCDY